MENLKISKLLNNSTASKFGWINVNDLSNGQYSVSKYSTFKTMLSVQCYDQIYVIIVMQIVKGRITVEGDNGDKKKKKKK